MATSRKTTTIRTTEISWVCGGCKTEWNTKRQADSCCERAVNEDITWVCGECKNEWRTKSQAQSCCGPDPECTRCGRTGHDRGECYARTHESGRPLGTKTTSAGACYRCGRTGHYVSDCYASTHRNGYMLD